MADKLIGNWICYKHEKLNEYFKKTGMTLLTRKAVLGLTVKEEISKTGDVWTITQTTSLSYFKYQFRIGEIFKSAISGTAMNGRARVQGNSLIVEEEKLTPDCPIPPSKSERYVTGNDEMILVMSADGTECTRFFKRYAPCG